MITGIFQATALHNGWNTPAWIYAAKIFKTHTGCFLKYVLRWEMFSRSLQATKLSITVLFMIFLNIFPLKVSLRRFVRFAGSRAWAFAQVSLVWTRCPNTLCG